MTEWTDKDEAFRKMYFASINEAFAQLPEHLDGRFANSKHLRRWALIKTHYANEQSLVFDKFADALRRVSYISRTQPESVVSIIGTVIKVWTAQSQSKQAMSPAEFRESASAVLDLLTFLLGVNVSELRRNAGKAA